MKKGDVASFAVRGTSEYEVPTRGNDLSPPFFKGGDSGVTMDPFKLSNYAGKRKIKALSPKLSVSPLYIETQNTLLKALLQKKTTQKQ